MAEQHIDREEAKALFRILKDRLSVDPEGRECIKQFSRDPKGGARRLTAYLQKRLAEEADFARSLAKVQGMPEGLSTVVYGGQVERIVNIAQAGVVIIRASTFRETALVISVVVVVGLILGTLSLINIRQGHESKTTPAPISTPLIDVVSVFQDKYISAIARDSRTGNLWVAVYGEECIYHYRRGESPVCSGKEGSRPQANVLTILVREEDGEVWFGTEETGVSVLRSGTETLSADDDEWLSRNFEDRLAGSTVYALAQDGQGGLWFGTSYGLCRLDREGRWKYYHPQIGWKDSLDALRSLPLEEQFATVYIIRVDPSGGVWIGIGDARGDALLRWPPGDYDDKPTRYSQEDELNETCKIGVGAVAALAFDHKGRPWVGTSQGSISFLREGAETLSKDDDCWQTSSVTSTTGTADTGILALLPLPGELVIVGTVGSGLYAYEPGSDRWAVYVVDDFSVTILLSGEKENQGWIGTSEGLWTYRFE